MREICSICNYSRNNCLCHAITKIENQTEVLILQHPKESSHAKNTVKLLKNSLCNITVSIGITDDDFATAKHRVLTDPCSTIVIYPHSKNIDLAQVKCHSPVRRIIAIDGSWKQAYKIWMSNEWLHELPCATINTDGIDKHYSIRKSGLNNSLSTLEAVSISLNAVEGLPTHALISLLNEFTKRWESYLP